MANLLIVDDNEDIAALTAMVLEAEGHLVRIARNGEEGLRALDTELQCRWFRLTECRS
jgi:CheY-like chemotaxis protein